MKLDADSLSRKAFMIHEQGYTCSETTLLAFARELGIDDKAIPKVATPFGGGIGRLCEECGVLTGGLMALGLKYGRTDPKDEAALQKSYAMARAYYEQFREKFGSTRCLQIQGRNLLDPEQFAKHQAERYICDRVIREGARILANILNEHQP